MKRIDYCMLFLLLTIGCRTVSVEQRKMVRQFASKTENFSVYPSTIWSELSTIRESRGVYYANSMTDPETHLKELDAIVAERLNNDRIPGRVTAIFRILDVYADGLTQLSSDVPFAKRTSLYETLGADLEELISTNNQLNQEFPLPAGTGSLLARILDSGSHHWLAHRQMKALRNYVTSADTLVGAVCNSMKKYLSSELLVRLIQNEESGIEESFRFYYTKRSPPTLDSERDYIVLKKKIQEVNQLRLKSIVAVKNLAKAHQMMVVEINQKQSAIELVTAMRNYYQEVESLRLLMKKINL